MAFIDTSSIENFDTMSDTEKVAALLKVEVPDKVDMSGFVEKTVLDKKLKELSEVNKKLASKMSEDELAEAERQRIQDESDQRYTDLESKYNELLKKSTIAEYKGKFLAQGMDEKMAGEAATALAENDTAKLFDIQQKFNDELKKKIEADLVKGTKKPDGAGGSQGETDPAVERAKRIGASRATANKESADILSKYIKS